MVYNTAFSVITYIFFHEWLGRDSSKGYLMSISCKIHALDITFCVTASVEKLSNIYSYYIRRRFFKFSLTHFTYLILI